MSTSGEVATTVHEGETIVPDPINPDNNSGSDVATDIIIASVPAAATASPEATDVVLKHSNSLSTLGDASGVAILLGNHAEFGLAERCCYHFDLMETLTAIPSKRVHQSIMRRKERGQSNSFLEKVSSVNNSDGANATPNVKSSSNDVAANQCVCGVVSLLECVAGGSGSQDRTTKRTLRSKHREFNTRAQFAWGRNFRGTSSGALKRQGKLGNATTPRRCHQPSHLPLALNPNTRVAFAYELTSIAILLDASPSLTSTIGVQCTLQDDCCVPLDRLGTLIKTYLTGLVEPIEVPPVSVSGLGIALGRWKPHLAVTVVAVYPPVSRMDCASAGLLVRDFRVTDESSAHELARQIECWALNEVEVVIGERLCGERVRSSVDNTNCEQHLPIMSPLGSFSPPVFPHRTRFTHVKSFMRDILAVGDAALSTLPPEGRPLLLVATDCLNVHCLGGIDMLRETARVDVPISVLDLSLNDNGSSQSEIPKEEFSPMSLSVSNDSQSLHDMCHLSGGIFLESSSLERYIKTTVGSPTAPSSTLNDLHFSSKKRSIKPNALQWYTIFMLSPFTPRGSLSQSRLMSASESGTFNISSSTLTSSRSCVSFSTSYPKTPISLIESRPNVPDTCVDMAANRERIVLARYNIQPIRIKSLLMTRVVEGYQARRYGHSTQDNDKVSVDLALPLPDWRVVVHYEVSFVSSSHHIPTVGQAHVKLELSGDDLEFLQIVKKLFSSNQSCERSVLRGIRVSASLKLVADKICKLLRWVRSEDYLESYLCSPGWDGVSHFDTLSTFLGRLESMTKLQRFRHFKTLTLEVVTVAPSCYISSNVMEQNKGERELFSAVSNWSTGVISDRLSYFKVIAWPKDDDLAYYCIIRVINSSIVSRLFTLAVDFHGELNVELRSAVLLSLKEALEECDHTLVLQKGISSYLRTRSAIPSPLSSCWSDFFVHHKSWQLFPDVEALPLITKRRTEVENFTLLHSDAKREVFAKLLKNEDSHVNEQFAPRRRLDIVIYEIISRADDIYVDIRMEVCQSTFYPFHAKHSDKSFINLFDTVRDQDSDCSKNLQTRSNLIAILNHVPSLPESSNDHGVNIAEDVLRFIRVSKRTKTKLRFFNMTGSGSANKLLSGLMIQHVTSDACPTRATRLCLNENIPILNFSGHWFIQRIGCDALSVVCLEVHAEALDAAESPSFRPLTFFTAGINDMYPSVDRIDPKRIDEDAQSSEDHFGVSRIAEEIQCQHAKDYARACYWALRDKSNPIISLQSDDVAYAISTLSFHECLSSFVTVGDQSASRECAQNEIGTRLWTVIGSLLRIVPGSNEQIFFYHEGTCDRSHSVDRNHDDCCKDNTSNDLQSNDESETTSPQPTFDDPPLFFRLTLDGELATLTSILELGKSVNLGAAVSTYSSSVGVLPLSHITAVSKLQILLNSFEAEQKLEQYRLMGCSLTEEICREVMLNFLPNSKHKSCEIMLEFYSSKADSLMPAHDFIGSSEKGFNILLNEFDKSTFTRVGHDTFLAYDKSTMMEILPYWCFVQLRKPIGVVVIQVHHPLGENSSEIQLQLTKGIVNRLCERTNQLLLLDSLFRTKTASSLLIPKEEAEKENLLDAGCEINCDAPYSCSVQYTAAIPLHRRCAPQQAMLALETTILQNFIVTNHRGVFVYKDELENVFYMKLKWFRVPNAKDTDQNPHVIELSVYGCDKPGPSITDHLVCLLKKKILTLTLEAISSLLKKNPWFNLLTTDLAFIKGFRSELKSLDREKNPSPDDCTRTYLLPTNVLDPLMILLMLRQNICGSTFFQRLHHEGLTTDLKSDGAQVTEDNGEVSMYLPKMPEFHFYFNSSPSQLDPHYQTGATLTERGAQYSRQAGSGIAIVEMALQYGNETQCTIQVGKRAEFMNEQVRVSKPDLSLSKCFFDASQHETRFKIKVEVINTTVNIDIIHKWVELSLSQVLAAWSIERHLEAARMGMLRHRGEAAVKYESICDNSEQVKIDSINQTIPGLQAMEDMIMIASDLPHPAIAHVECQGMMRATLLANLTLDVLDAILSTIIPKTKTYDGVDIIRYNSLEGASIVNIRKGIIPTSSARVELLGKETEVTDPPTSSPQYIVIFGMNSESDKSIIQSPQNMFFKHVFSGIEQDTFSFSQALSKVKNLKPSLFQRNLVFMVKISRCNRTLMTYNAHPQLRARLENRFKEINQAVANSELQYFSALQSRCLHHVSFLPTASALKPTTANDPSTAKLNASNKEKPKNEELKSESSENKREPPRRIPRPTTMLRPKLIGKSIEGSAMQAVAARRLKASSGPVLLQRTVSGSGKKNVTTVVTAPRKETPTKIDKPASVEKIISGSCPSALPMLKSIMTTYSAEFQQSTPGYRLQRRFLSPATFLEGPLLLDSCKKRTLVKHFISHCKTYNLTCSGTGDDACFAGKMDIAGFIVHYFISWHETVEDALDVFVVCATNGKNIDGYISKAGSQYSERTLDVISSTTMAAVRGVIESASRTIRRLHMWKFFVKDGASQLLAVPRETLIDNIAELRRCTNHVNLVSVDPRLSEMLQDTSNELRISWPQVFDAMAKSSLFSHCTAMEYGETMTYLLYFKEEDVFLDLMVSSRQQQHEVEDARILTKEQLLSQDNSKHVDSEIKVTPAVKNAVEKFVMFLLQWLWNDCESKIDC